MKRITERRMTKTNEDKTCTRGEDRKKPTERGKEGNVTV